MTKVFVDTNVLIDFICSREPYYDDAEELFSYALAGKIDVCFTDISIINTIYVGKKYSFTVEELSSLLKYVLGFCKVSEINSSTLLRALSSEWKDKEDATQYFSAIDSVVDTIITRNIKDFALSTLPVSTPKEFLKNM